jgi:outer membrane protein assembly factor BamD
MKKIMLAVLAALFLLGACSQNQVILTTDEKLAKADEFYNKGKFTRAAELYGQVYFERASASAAYALMRQGDSYFKVNRFTDARVAYDEYANTFNNRPDVSIAVFRSAVCLYEESLSAQYDQTETIQSIEAFRKFMEKYPRDERVNEAIQYIQKAQYKLIEKKFRTGYIYYKMKDYSSALMYFKEVTDLGNTDSLDRQSLYYSAMLLHRQKLGDQARAAYDTLMSKYPGSQEGKKLAKYFK